MAESKKESKFLRILSIFGAILTAVTIFYFSSIQNDPVPQIDIPLKAIIYHFLIFFIFAMFLAGSLNNKSKDGLIAMATLALWYAATDEFHQLFVPGRVASFKDWIIDGTGVLLANIIYLIKINHKKIKKK